MSSHNDNPDSFTIQLNLGQSTIVSPEDADLAKYKWYAQFDSTYSGGGRYHARRTYKLNKKNCSELLHRAILARILGRVLLRTEFCDHINGDTLDNRRSNLRIATVSQNNTNQARRADNKSGYKGVQFNKQRQKYIATIRKEGKIKHLGCFTDPAQAYEAYCKAAIEIHGEFAKLE